MGAISLIPLLMSVALLSRTALDMTREGDNYQRKEEEERPASYRSHSLVPAWGNKILQEPQQTETDFSDHQVLTSNHVLTECIHVTSCSK